MLGVSEVNLKFCILKKMLRKDFFQISKIDFNFLNSSWKKQNSHMEL